MTRDRPLLPPSLLERNFSGLNCSGGWGASFTLRVFVMNTPLAPTFSSRCLLSGLLWNFLLQEKNRRQTRRG